MNEFTVDDRQHIMDDTINSVRWQYFMGITGVEGLDMILSFHQKPQLSLSTSQKLCRGQAGLPPEACSENYGITQEKNLEYHMVYNLESCSITHVIIGPGVWKNL